MNLNGKVAIVTGSTKGIGRAIAETLVREGLNVCVSARKADEVERAVRELSDVGEGKVTGAVCDVRDYDEVKALFEHTVSEFGGVDVLVNNAGMPKRRRVQDLCPAEVDEVMRLNYVSPVRLTLALLPGMLARGHGHLVAVGSVAARLGPPHEAAYGASKAAVTAFWESMVVDLDGTGVQVHLVQPALIDTGLFSVPGNEPPLSDLADALPPQEAAAAVLEVIGTGRFERYVPDWFHEMASGKAADVEAFVAGVKDWTRERLRDRHRAAGS